MVIANKIVFNPHSHLITSCCKPKKITFIYNHKFLKPLQDTAGVNRCVHTCACVCVWDKSVFIYSINNCFWAPTKCQALFQVVGIWENNKNKNNNKKTKPRFLSLWSFILLRKNWKTTTKNKTYNVLEGNKGELWAQNIKQNKRLGMQPACGESVRGQETGGGQWNPHWEGAT